MVRPTANTEAGGAKILILEDATATTPNAKNPIAAAQSVTGDSNSPGGWMGVATGADGEVALASAGLTPKDTAGTARAPLILIGGKDYAASPVQRAIRIDENGNIVMAGIGHAMAALALADATAGGTDVTNTTTETAISTVDAARFGYLCSIDAICRVVGSNAAIATFTLKDGATGATLHVFDVPVNCPVGVRLGQMSAGAASPIIFPVPYKTNAINKAFTITASVNTCGTWRFKVNGFRSTL